MTVARSASFSSSCTTLYSSSSVGEAPSATPSGFPSSSTSSPSSSSSESFNNDHRAVSENLGLPSMANFCGCGIFFCLRKYLAGLKFRGCMRMCSSAHADAMCKIFVVRHRPRTKPKFHPREYFTLYGTFDPPRLTISRVRK